MWSAILKAANFDPEFFSRYEKEIASEYNRLFPQRPVQQKPLASLRRMVFGSRRRIPTPTSPSSSASSQIENP